MKKFKFKTIHVVAFIVFATAFVLNIHANVNLGSRALAASGSGSAGSGDSGGSGGSGGWLWQKVMTDTDCTETRTVTVWVCAGVVVPRPPSGAHGCYQEERETIFNGKMSRCDDGWKFCLSGCEGA